jgi:hypothetical protein
MTPTNAVWLMRVEAMRLAKLQTKQEIKDQGRKWSDFAMKEITLLSEVYVREHRAELMQQAARTILRSRLLRMSKVSHSKAARGKSKPWAVRISGAK